MPETRQLAAIMFTDIVGYTALMGKDETAAYQLLKKNRQLQKPLIEKHSGKWLKEMGDGVLASFRSISDAVYCAIEIQRKCKNEGHLKLRIGIHLGEVIVEGDDVFGDGVNIASRLEAIAPVGGIWVSESVERNIQNKKGIETNFIREEVLKNVKDPVKIYQVKVEGIEIIESLTSSAKHSLATKPAEAKFTGQQKVIFTSLAIIIILVLAYFIFLVQKKEEAITYPIESEAINKSLAILPFADKSPEGNQEWYSDGMTEEIRKYLVQLQKLKITSGTATMHLKESDKSLKEIGEELGVAYILDGSVMRLDNNIKINVQLIDVSTGEYRWAESYDQELTGVFSILSEVAQKVAYTLDDQIQPQLIERMEQMPTDNMEAYDLYLKTSSMIGVPTLENLERIGWLNQAIKLDSNFARAYALLGNYIIFQAGFAQNKNPADVGEEAKALLEKALLLDPLDAIAHIMMASYSLWYGKDFNKAEMHYLIAKELAPSDESSYASYHDLLLAEGRFQEAIPIGAKLLEIASNNPANWGRSSLQWAFNDDEGKMNKSIRRARQAPTDNILAFTESARAYLVQKQYPKVLEILDLSVDAQEIPRSMGLKSIAYYQIGDNENHNIELDSLIHRSTWTAGGSPSFYTAMVYASKGKVDMAFKWLEKSYQDNEVELYWLKVEPEFESLHDDPRYQEMLDKVGFPN
jgi:TolB-like protein/class 3 adenylate cyclase